MKSKAALSLIALSIVLLSIGMASASENSTQIADELQAGDDDILQMSNEEDVSVNQADEVELHVSVESNCKSPVKKGDTVYMAITAKSNGGTACDTRIYANCAGTEYITHLASAGNYNKDTKIWNVGNLTPDKPAHLIIKARVTQKTGNLIFEALGTTSSNSKYSLSEHNNTNYGKCTVPIVNSQGIYDPFERQPNPNKSRQSNNDTLGSDDTKNNHPEHYFSTEYFKTSKYKSDDSGPFSKSARAASNSPVKSNNASKANKTRPDYNEPFSITKAMVYLSENILYVAAVALVAIIAGAAYYKRKQ
jgi:hypothetical protein